MKRAFAMDSSVSVDRTRAEVNQLLKDWECSAIGWTDHLTEGRVDCSFTWTHDGAIYRVRFSIGIPTRLESRTHRRGFSWEWSKRIYVKEPGEAERAQLWRSAHRLLLLKLKADLNAAQSGLAKAEEIFLPWMVDRDGNTVAELLLPRLRETYAALPPRPAEGK